ncbi:unnamed protein product [Arctia plantaginis]|uniref:Uncharacterized protein n=1 Tax=Arctia plantaginis TaxID=874455 RepID=A0A8S1BE61_ARCPL|nr:unnamed protein product [Arctia plantaginis]
MQFENKVVLVTGSGSGIGEATVLHFAKEGADVVIVDYNEGNARKVAEKVKEFGKRVLVIKTDVSKDVEARTAIEKTINEFGRLDVLVNNAGIAREGLLIDGTIMNHFDEVLSVNLRGAVLMTSLATPYLIKSKGAVVNTSSIVTKSLNSLRGFPCYGIAKAGLDHFTREAAYELAPSGVRVNAVSPGPVNTNMAINCNLDVDASKIAETTALKKCALPEEVANVIVFLASDKASSVTGSSYALDNGISLM